MSTRCLRDRMRKGGRWGEKREKGMVEMEMGRGMEGIEKKKGKQEKNIKKRDNLKNMYVRREPIVRGTGKGKRRLRGEKGGKYKENARTEIKMFRTLERACH